MTELESTIVISVHSEIGRKLILSIMTESFIEHVQTAKRFFFTLINTFSTAQNVNRPQRNTKPKIIGTMSQNY